MKHFEKSITRLPGTKSVSKVFISDFVRKSKFSASFFIYHLMGSYLHITFLAKKYSLDANGLLEMLVDNIYNDQVCDAYLYQMDKITRNGSDFVQVALLAPILKNYCIDHEISVETYKEMTNRLMAFVNFEIFQRMLNYRLEMPNVFSIKNKSEVVFRSSKTLRHAARYLKILPVPTNPEIDERAIKFNEFTQFVKDVEYLGCVDRKRVTKLFTDCYLLNFIGMQVK